MLPRMDDVESLRFMPTEVFLYQHAKDHTWTIEELRAGIALLKRASQLLTQDKMYPPPAASVATAKFGTMLSCRRDFRRSGRCTGPPVGCLRHPKDALALAEGPTGMPH